MTANYLLRVLLDNGVVEALVIAEDDDRALTSALRFVGCPGEVNFELYDVSQEVARRVC